MSHMARLGMAATCLVVALLAGAAAFLGVFARGTGAYISVTSVRGETYDMATNGVYAYNAQRVVAEGVGWDVVTLILAVPALPIAIFGVASLTSVGLLTRVDAGPGLGARRATARTATPAAG